MTQQATRTKQTTTPQPSTGRPAPQTFRFTDWAMI